LAELADCASGETLPASGKHQARVAINGTKAAEKMGRTRFPEVWMDGVEFTQVS